MAYDLVMNYCISKPVPRRFFALYVLIGALFVSLMSIGQAGAADRDRVKAFLNVTGFDVALDSIALSAETAPRFLGMDPAMFGPDWTRMTKDVFDTAVMRTIALDILEATLDDDILNHAVEFYTSDLGQRLVVAENASHLARDSDDKHKTGDEIIEELTAKDAPRLDLLNRMNQAIDASGTSLRALQEIQVRFLMAASAAGIIELSIDADGLRSMLKSQEDGMRRALEKSALAGAAFTYQGFSDADIKDYAVALEQPKMQRIYELLNAVQYEIMANRFEVLAGRMADLKPAQDI